MDRSPGRAPGLPVRPDEPGGAGRGVAGYPVLPQRPGRRRRPSGHHVGAVDGRGDRGRCPVRERGSPGVPAPADPPGVVPHHPGGGPRGDPRAGGACPRTVRRPRPTGGDPPARRAGDAGRLGLGLAGRARGRAGVPGAGGRGRPVGAGRAAVRGGSPAGSAAVRTGQRTAVAAPARRGRTHRRAGAGGYRRSAPRRRAHLDHRVRAVTSEPGRRGGTGTGGGPAPDRPPARVAVAPAGAAGVRAQRPGPYRRGRG